MTRDELQAVLKQGLAEVDAGKEGELALARSEAKRWKDEWQGLLEVFKSVRDSRTWADQAYFKAKEEANELTKRMHQLERENYQLRELVEADNVQIKLLERQVERLTKAKEVEP